MNSISDIKDYLRKYLVRFFKGKSIISYKDDESFINKLLHEFDELHFSSAEDLLDLHFVLQDEVISYLKSFPNLLADYRYTTQLEYFVSKGKVNGAIDWNKTITRQGSGKADSQYEFIISSNRKFEHTDENKVLFMAINTILRILKNDFICEKLKNEVWFEDTKNALNSVEQVIQNNVFLTNDYQFHLDERIVTKVANNKLEIYSESAKLLDNYFKLIDGSILEKVKILVSSFVDNCNENTLFELFWIFKIIEENCDIESVDFKTVLPQECMIAQWEDKKSNKYYAYHNCGNTGTVSFVVKDTQLVNNKKCKYDYHTINVLKRFDAYRKAFFGINTERHNVFNGRPDFIIERFNKKGVLDKVILGEVKNTKDITYALEGLFELIQYMEYIGIYDKGLDSLDFNNVTVEGILCSKVSSTVPKVEGVTWRYLDDKVTSSV